MRIGVHEWVVVRNNPRYPKAVIRRIDAGRPTEHYRVVSFDLDPAARRLLGRYTTLEAANDSVLYDIVDKQPASYFGMYENRPSAGRQRPGEPAPEG